MALVSSGWCRTNATNPPSAAGSTRLRDDDRRTIGDYSPKQAHSKSKFRNALVIIYTEYIKNKFIIKNITQAIDLDNQISWKRGLE
ncbi:hypothetical protein C9J01_11415 [Photobacterium rosenbergii]|uniref:Uncharacterized protein n=1 Tax=Photobacterium rosenbergii TaxID=294936 RepID=A0A2T3NFW0_9GAMM|nr:hypothetical protein C9J01_11415 [Photobacterium rosenbergii]